MSHPKKNANLFRFALINILLGFLLLLYPFLLLINFSLALCYLFILSTISTFNVVNLSKKTVLSPFTTMDDIKGDKFSSKKIERKEFSVSKVLTALIISTAIYYAVCVLFGAAVLNTYFATLYFSVLMTILTVYPLMWYFFFTDNLSTVIKIYIYSKFDNLTETHLHSIIVCTVIGAWLGAFPIPLDWDRPWQTWPTTCCIGASIGNSAIHLLIGFTHFRDKRKLVTNRAV